MPAQSKSQQKLMGIVHAIQKGEADPKDFSKQAQQMAKDMKPGDVKDFASTKHKGLPTKKEEGIKSLKEYIRKLVREMNTTANVQGYQTPFAFNKPGAEKKKAKKQADLTGYTPVNENKDLDKETLLKIFNLPKGAQKTSVKRERNGYTVKFDDPKTGAQTTSFLSQTRIDNHLAGKLKETISENRWLELKNEDTPAKAKIDRGISNINKQLAEMEKFLNWYGRLKNENGVTNETFWKRTNRNIYSIKERLMKLEQKIRKISE